MAAVDNMAPQFAIKVGDQDIGGLARLVRSVEFESADGIADMAKVKLANPGFALSESKMLQPGNELSVYMGYGTANYLGRVVIARFACDFPQDAMPTATVTGYSFDHAMLDNSPDEGAKRTFVKPSAKDILSGVAERYAMRLDVDDYQYARNVTQKAGMSDYDLVKGLANVAGFLFWVDAEEGKPWVLHFADPAGRVGKSPMQTKRYFFKYAQGEVSTLLSFSPEYAVTGSRTKIALAIRDPEKGQDFVEIVEEKKTAPDLKSKGKATDDEQLKGPIPSGATIKLYFGQFSQEIVPNKGFEDVNEARAWAQWWFQQHRENFVIGNGKLIGIEDLTARQVHALDGLGIAFDGDYYFTRVRHVMRADSSYVVDFSARKHLT